MKQKNINFNGLPKNITVGELIKMSKVNLPEGFKITIKQKPKEPFAEQLVEDLK